MNGDGIIYFKSTDHVYRGNFLNGMPDGKYANFGKLGYQKIEFFKGDVVSAKSGCIFDRNFQVLGVFSNQNLSINKCYEIIRKN